jgi:hypothetical protein
MSDWSGIMTVIAEAAGDAAALQIQHAKGGLEAVSFPRPEHLNPNHWLVDLVGMEAATAVCSAIGGRKVTIPMGATANLGRRWRAMQTAMEGGASNSEAALAAGVHQRTVRRYRGRAGLRRDPGQGNLF